MDFYSYLQKIQIIIFHFGYGILEDNKTSDGSVIVISQYQFLIPSILVVLRYRQYLKALGSIQTICKKLYISQ